MKKNQHAKEELVNMLSEIYQQLEELEKQLDSNFSGIRSQWQQHTQDQLSTCTENLELLEKRSALLNSSKSAEKDAFHRQPSIKLELGYKLH